MLGPPPPASRHRRLLWIEGSATDSRACASALLQEITPGDIAWVGDPHSDTHYTALPLGKGRQVLGQTLHAGVIDAHAGFDPDDLGAMTGAIIGGGYCLLLTPPADQWPAHPDAGMTPLLSHGLSLSDCREHFIRRLCDLLAGSAAVSRLNAAPSGQTIVPLPAPTAGERVQPIRPTTDQQTLIDAIQTLNDPPEPGRLLITADRGRGKSAALGMAIKALAPIPVRLTAVSRAAAATVLEHAGPARPAFLAPERVSAAPDLLMIDEAAALPMGMVEQLVRENLRCVLTSTVHGYEGSGHGLTLRLAKRLAQESTPFRHLTLTEPVRWAIDDPLEQLVDRILLLSAEPAPLKTTAQSNLMIEPIDPATLAGDESRLRAAFGLLVTGHYKTRPRDLRQLLDDPAVRCWGAWSASGTMVGILSAREEGGLDPALTRAIHAGTRRPPGHLIAQSLTFHAGIEAAACQRGLRIQRIAVHPDAQRQGIGTALVDQTIAAARAAELDWLGTSFGFAHELLEFWLACGLQPARFGHRADPRSGAQAVIMLKALSARGARLLDTARTKLAESSSSNLEQRL